MRRQIAPGRWIDDGPQLQYRAGAGLGAVPLSVAQPVVTSAWPVPRPHGTPLSRTPEYRRAYEASYRARRGTAA